MPLEAKQSALLGERGMPLEADESALLGGRGVPLEAKKSALLGERGERHKTGAIAGCCRVELMGRLCNQAGDPCEPSAALASGIAALRANS